MAKGVIMDSNGQAVISTLPAISTLFSQTSTQVITGTTESSLKGSLYGTDVISPSDFYVGKTWIGFINGTYTSAPVSVGNLTARLYLDSVLVLSNTVGSLPVNVSTLSYTSHIQFVCRATGSNGSIAASGYIEFSIGTSLTTLKLFFTPTVTSIDLSVSRTYNPTAQYSLFGNTINSMTHTLISLN